MTSKFSINKSDIISTLRNWAILNSAILIANWNTITIMLENWTFDFVELRKMLVLSVSSLLLFMVKRFFMGEKKLDKAVK